MMASEFALSHGNSGLLFIQNSLKDSRRLHAKARVGASNEQGSS